ncbi:MAG: HepT-like ribonuclease domain-containing protein [Caldilineaceae bacterium]
MSDLELVRDILSNIMIAITRIERRCERIASADDFVSSDEGIDRLDGIAMMLLAMGEQLKRLEKALGADLNTLYPEVDWKGAKGIRDFLSHHYFVLDAEVVFDVCQNKLGGLKQAIQAMQVKFFENPSIK